MTINTDKVIVESGADFTFVCRKIPFAISCLNLHQGNTNLIDLDLVNKMKIPLRNIKVTRISLLGHDMRAVGRIKQTVQCVRNGRVQGNIHLEGKVVRDLFSILDVDCLASSKTYERLMNRKPPDPVDEGYDSHEEVPSLGGDEEEEDIDNKEVEEHSIAKDQQRVEVKEEKPPDPPDQVKPTAQPKPLASLNPFKHPLNPNLAVIECEYPKQENSDSKEDIDNDMDVRKESDSMYALLAKIGPGPRDLYEASLNVVDEDEEDKYHCDLCFRDGKPYKVVSNHSDGCPTCPSMTQEQKLKKCGPHWKAQAEMIIRMRYQNEKGKKNKM